MDEENLEERLRESERRFRVLAELTSDYAGAFRMQPDGRLLPEWTTGALSRITGYTVAELNEIGGLIAIVHPDDLERARQQMEAMLSGQSFVDEFRIIRKDGEIRWLRDRVHVELDPATGAPIRFYTAAQDITDQKSALEERVTQQQFIQKMFDTNPNVLYVFDLDKQKTVFQNRHVVSAIGYTATQLVDMEDDMLTQIVHPDDLPRLAEHFTKMRAASDHDILEIEYRVCHADGTWSWFLSRDAVFRRGSNGRVQQIMGTAIDISLRKQTEAALRQSETQLQHLIDTVPEGVLLLDATHHIILANPLAAQYLQILAVKREAGRLARLGNRPLADLLTSPPQGLWHEITAQNYTFEAISRPLENQPQNSGWVLVLRDVTQEREIQQRMQRQERLAAVGQLAAGIAHDFNNILAVIMLYTQLISRTVNLPRQAQERLQTITQQTQRATELIQQILDFSRQSVLERQPLDLVPFMKELVKLLGRTLPEHIQIDLDYTADSCVIYADPSRIQQMIMNLAVNARDAMPKGGALQIRLSHLQPGKGNLPSVPAMPAGHWIQLEVADSGSGIPAEVLPHIFEPFFTTKEVGQGTGLGLAQVYGIVQQHEGYIDTVTEIGRGTRFFIYFPILNIDKNHTMNLDTADLQQGQGQTILVVEDDETTRQALIDSLALLDYEMIAAANGEEALNLLATANKEVAVVLSDVVMPKMGGVALLHAMRQRNLRIPVVLLTGHPFRQDLQEVQKLGLAGWLSKPINLVELSQLLGQIIAANG